MALGGVKFITKQSEINKVLNGFTDRVGQAFLKCLIFLGDELVARAKANGQYNNVTFRLRSSVGYQVGVYGKVVRSSFSTGRREGAMEGRNLATSIIAANSQHEFILVVVAGMNYAKSVEARGKDVLTSTEIFANQRIPSMLKALNIS